MSTQPAEHAPSAAEARRPRRPASRNVGDPDPFGGLHILVVDDDADMQALVGASLGALGEIEYCADAYDALARFQAESFDVVVVDLRLPGASGVDLLERLSATGMHIPAVVVTGADPDGALTERAKQAGAVAIMQKPLDRRLLAFNVAQATRWVNT